MADLLLVLVVFFMSISSTAFFHRDRLIQLPQADKASNHLDGVDEMVISVEWIRGARAGSIKVDDRTFSQPEALIPLLSSRLEAHPMLRVVIRADRDVEYSFLASILQACRQAQIPSVVFSVAAPKS